MGSGAPPSKAGWRKGRFAVGGREYAFVLSSGKGGAICQVSIDRGGDGDFGGDGDGPFATGETVELAGRRWAVTIGPKSGVGKFDLRLTYPCAAEVRGRLAEYEAALGSPPEYLCIVGRPDVIPQAIVRNREGQPQDIATDVPLA